MNLVIFGPQGCGKGTQADLICGRYHLRHIETGFIFREIAKENSPLGRKIHRFNENKEMIPDKITVDILGKKLKEISMDEGVILDSAPRTSGQIEPIEKMFAKLGRKIDRAIYITLPYEKSIERISKRYRCLKCKKRFVLDKDIKNLDESCPQCGGTIAQRIDDTPDGIAKRLRIFHEVTTPVIEYYREKGILIEVNGDQDIKKVFEDIAQALD